MTAPLCRCGDSKLDHDGRRGECSAQHDDGEDCECEGYDVRHDARDPVALEER